MGNNPLSDEAYERVHKTVKEKGSATHAGEQRHKEGKGLHELVDPKAYGVIRRSISWLEPQEDGTFVLLRGTAMLEETRLDTTGSLGGNVNVAMRVLPKTHTLLARGPRAILRRYDVQMITAIFGDVDDNYILCRSQAEIDERIAEQMTYMVPEKQGYDPTEDPQYGLFGAAYLTSATIKMLGLKSYDFTITDADARDILSMHNLVRVFGPEVLDKVRENGFEIDEHNLPTTKEIVRDMLKTTHAFMLIVGESTGTIRYWNNIYGPDRVVLIPEMELLPEIKAAIIGLTEGVLDLSTLEEYLMTVAGVNSNRAASIKRAVAGIPIGAQMLCDNFDKIPLKGDIFAAKKDLWPISKDDVGEKKGKEVWS